MLLLLGVLSKSLSLMGKNAINHSINLCKLEVSHSRLSQKTYQIFALVLYYTLLIRFPTQPMPGYQIGYFLRRLAMKWIAESCGKGVIIKQNCYVGKGTGLRIGNCAQLGHNARIDQHVTIGDDVIMGPDVIVMTNHHAFEDINVPINKQGKLFVRPVTIGNDVWIDARVIILPGVKVEDQAVIGAGAVVTKNVPERAIVAGNPARIIRFRGERANNTGESSDV